MIIKEKITIPGLSGKLKRRIYIYLPPDYEESGARYPVMYMFDGHNVFFDKDATYGKSWGMYDYLKQHDPALIIVAVECNSRGNRRLSEYSPWDFDEGYGLIKGRGKEYMDWTVHKLKPFIDSEFRTLSEREYTYICGSSMGGLMTVYALTAYNEYFSKGAALSPSLWCRPDLTLNMIHNSEPDPNTMLFMDYGSCELSNHSRMLSLLQETFIEFYQKNVFSTLRIVPGGEHCEACWEEEIPVFMECLGIKSRK